MITANLAAQLAMEGKSVGVADADLRSPGIQRYFGLDESSMGKTLNDFLNGKCEIKDVAFNIGENVGSDEGRAQLAGKDIWLFPSSIRGSDISQILRKGYDVNLLNTGLQTLMKEFDLDFGFRRFQLRSIQSKLFGPTGGVPHFGLDQILEYLCLIGVFLS